MKKTNLFRKMFWLLLALSAATVCFTSCGEEDNTPPAPTFKIVHMDFGRLPPTRPTVEMIQNALAENDSVYINPINTPGATGSWAGMLGESQIVSAALNAEELAISPRVTANPKNNTIYVPAEFYQGATHEYCLTRFKKLNLKVASR